MSAMCCKYCGRLVDTDFDPDSLYVRGHDGECVCSSCRDQRKLLTEFDDEPALLQMPRDWQPTPAQQAIIDAAEAAHSDEDRIP